FSFLPVRLKRILIFDRVLLTTMRSSRPSPSMSAERRLAKLGSIGKISGPVKPNLAEDSGALTRAAAKSGAQESASTVAAARKRPNFGGCIARKLPPVPGLGELNSKIRYVPRRFAQSPVPLAEPEETGDGCFRIWGAVSRGARVGASS